MVGYREESIAYIHIPRIQYTKDDIHIAIYMAISIQSQNMNLKFLIVIHWHVFLKAAIYI